MRPAIGLIAILLLVIGGVLLLFNFESGEQIGGPCLRIGILMVLVWMAEPQLRRLPPWLPIAVIVMAIVLAWRPRLFPLGLLIVVVLWFLRPRTKRPVR